MDDTYPILTELLEIRNISVADLADKLSLTEEELRRILSGESPILLAHALEICRLLNTTDIITVFTKI